MNIRSHWITVLLLDVFLSCQRPQWNKLKPRQVYLKCPLTHTLAGGWSSILLNPTPPRSPSSSVVPLSPPSLLVVPLSQFFPLTTTTLFLCVHALALLYCAPICAGLKRKSSVSSCSWGENQTKAVTMCVTEVTLMSNKCLAALLLHLQCMLPWHHRAKRGLSRPALSRSAMWQYADAWPERSRVGTPQQHFLTPHLSITCFTVRNE